MRIVHIHRMRGIGGSERHLLTLLPALARRGLDVHFIGLDDPTGDLDPFYEELGLPVVRLRAPRDLDPRLALALRRTVRRLRPEVVHTHLVHADVYGALARGRAALVSTKHNDDPFRAGAFRFVERGLAHRADRVIAITEALRRFCVGRVGIPPAKVEVVHYGLDALPRAWREDPAFELPAEARVLLCVSRLARQKGVDLAAAALSRVRDRHPGTVLVVLGEGPEAEALSDVDGLYLAGRVGDVAGWYRRAEIVVHPARWEGFGLALLEAMLAGKPVVATRVSSIPEIVADGQTGILVPPEDPDAIAQALTDLLDDPARAEALGRAGLARARSEFSVDRMAGRTEAIYAAVTAGARSASR